jgi:ABC-2 type transport system ATP-binding protein
VIADDTASRLRSGLGDLVTLAFADEEAATIAAEGASWALVGTPGEAASVERVGTTVRARAAGAADRVARFVVDLESAGAPVRRVEVASATLDDVFLELTGRSLRESNEQSTDESGIESKGAAA